MSGKAYFSGVYGLCFLEYNLFCIAQVVDFEVYLFQIDFCYFQADHISNITLLSQELFFPFMI
jgi:hypothetical protein